MIRHLRVALVLILILWSGDMPPALAQPAQQPRYALVVANASYSFVGSLQNPVRDAQMLAMVLRKQKFDVTLVTDPTRAGLKTSIVDFRKRVDASPNALTFVFYSGHGIQSDGQNLLLMKDARLTEKGFEQGVYPTLEFMFDLKSPSSAGTIFVFDACRSMGSAPGDNASGFAATASEVLPSDTLVAYSTSPGRIASDGPPQIGSPYARSLATQMSTPALPVEIMFSVVRQQVFKGTNQTQEPLIISKLPPNVILSVEVASEGAKLLAQSKAKYYGQGTGAFGSGQPLDVKGAYEFALKAAKLNYLPAMGQVATQLYSGDGVRKDVDEAVTWWRRAADKGDEDALMTLAMVSSDRADFDRARPLMEKLAADGDFWVGYKLGLAYETGHFLPTDLGKAFLFYDASARSGYGPAMVNLGLMHKSGNGTPVDRQKALGWFRRAAESGIPRGMTQYAMMLSAIGTRSSSTADDALAVQWFRLAAPTDVFAVQRLAWHYYFGRGVSQDRNEAIRLWKSIRRHPIGEDSMSAEAAKSLSRVKRGGEWRECGTLDKPSFCPV
jgi:TPR repeat protein